MSTIAIRQQLERDIKLRAARVSKRDDVVADRLLDAMQLRPGTDAPGVADLNYESRTLSIGLLDEASDDGSDIGDRWDGQQ